MQPAKKRFLLVAPLVVLPFLCAIFVALGGGRGKTAGRHAPPPGLNLELPEAFPAARKSLLDKLGAYQRADADSMRKQQFAGQDPYRAHTSATFPRDAGNMTVTTLRPVAAPPRETDTRADALLSQLNRLRTSLHQPIPRPHPVDTATEDPQLERLDQMLDKVIRIQHPGEPKPAADRGIAEPAAQLVPFDSTANAIPAVIPENETLLNGSSLALRLSDSARLHGTILPAGTWVYGTVAFHNDRMTVQIRSIRIGNNLYSADLQAYDLDGMPGIHIPVRISQEVLKQSAEQSVTGINLLATDFSWREQAANAGVQAGKSLLSRKVRQVRVTVRAGYAVLLRNTGATTLPRPAVPQPADSSLGQPPEPPIDAWRKGRLLAHTGTEGLSLGLRGAYLRGDLLWLALEWRNRSAIGFHPQYFRWTVRDRHHFRRMAQQDLPLEPATSVFPNSVPGDSTVGQWVAFKAFALARDKELLLQVGERTGGREMQLVIPAGLLVNAKLLDDEKEP